MANYPLVILLKFKLFTCDFKFNALSHKVNLVKILLLNLKIWLKKYFCSLLYLYSLKT